MFSLVGIAASVSLSAVSLADATPLPPTVSMSTAQRIVGGANATSSDAPWQVAILDFSTFGVDSDYSAQTCGGTIIAPTWVITAAHCVDSTYFGQLAVLSGTTTLSDVDYSESKISSLANVFVHPEYGNPHSTSNDLALLQLERPLKIVDGVREAAQLPHAAITTGANLRVTGWGATNNAMSTYPTALKKSTQQVNDDTDCAIYDVYEPDTQLCIGFSPYTVTAACAGDSGGPAASIVGSVAVIVGVTGYGDADGCIAGAPAVFADVYSQLDWIRTVTGIAQSTGLVSNATIARQFTTVYPTKDGFRDKVAFTVNVSSSAGPDVIVSLGTGSTVEVSTNGVTVASWPVRHTGPTTFTWDGRESTRVRPGTYVLTVAATGQTSGAVTASTTIVVSRKKLVTHKIRKTLNGNFFNLMYGPNFLSCIALDGNLRIEASGDARCAGEANIRSRLMRKSYAKPKLTAKIRVASFTNGRPAVYFGVDGANGASRRIAKAKTYTFTMGSIYTYDPNEDDGSGYTIEPYFDVPRRAKLTVSTVTLIYTFKVLE